MPKDSEKKDYLGMLAATSLDVTTIFLGVVIIAAASYFFGFNLIREPLRGSDAVNILSMAGWLNEHYPSIPLWYPLQGGGVSFVLGYPPLYPVLLVWLHRMFGLGMLEVMGIINFAALFIPAFGVFLFVLMRFRLRFAALLSGLFFLLSPFSYALMSGGGFVANALANIFAVFTLVFFDWFLTSFLDAKSNRKIIVSLLLGAVTFMLTTISHPVTSIGIAVLMFFYFCLVGLLKKGKKGLKKGFLAYLLIGVFSFLLSAFWFVPFSNYTNFSNRDIAFTSDTSVLPPLTIKSILGLEKSEHELLVNLSIIPFVWIMAIAATLIAIVRKKWKIFSMGVITLTSIVLMGTTGIWKVATDTHWLLGAFIGHRYYFSTTIILPPILAGVGVWYISELPFFWFFDKLKNKAAHFKVPIKTVTYLIAIFISVGIIHLGVAKLNSTSGFYQEDKSWMLHMGEEDGIDKRSLWNRFRNKYPCKYGKEHELHNGRCSYGVAKSFTEVNLLIKMCEKYEWADKNEIICQLPVFEDGQLKEGPAAPDFEEFRDRCKQEDQPDYVYDICLAFSKTSAEQLSNWPKPLLSSFESVSELETYKFSEPESPNHFLSEKGNRIDISPSNGAWVKEWGVVNRSSMINAYTGQLVLNKPYQSFFRDSFYEQDIDEELGLVSNLAGYFGIEGVITAESDSTNKFKDRNWEEIFLNDYATFWKNPDTVGVYSIEKKPEVLVIGSRERQAYNQVFRAASYGFVPFDKGVLIEGAEDIDDYELSELKNYDVLILNGYSYSNKNGAYSLLENFVKDGGSIFIDTGWQYVTPDWGGEGDTVTSFPQVMPILETQWGDVGTEFNNANLDEAISGEVETDNFNSLTWDGNPWSLAYSNSDSVREWAEPFVSVNGRVILAGGTYGDGKIVWSGMNLISHAMNPINSDEIKMLENVYSYLVGDVSGVSIYDIDHQREPDRLEVNVQDSYVDGTFYFRESYYPYWQAYLVGSNGEKDSLEIQQAGPRFMLVDLSKASAGDTLLFEFVPGVRMLIPKLVSLFSFIFLILLFFDAGFRNSSLIKKILARFEKISSRLGRPLSHAKKDLTSSEEYDY